MYIHCILLYSLSLSIKSRFHDKKMSGRKSYINVTFLRIWNLHRPSTSHHQVDPQHQPNAQWTFSSTNRPWSLVVDRPPRKLLSIHILQPIHYSSHWSFTIWFVISNMLISHDIQEEHLGHGNYILQVLYTKAICILNFGINLNLAGIPVF